MHLPARPLDSPRGRVHAVWMKTPRREPSRYVTLHVSLAKGGDGSYSVSLVERTWSNGAKDGGRVLHRGRLSKEARPGSHDELMWMIGVYFQQLAAHGVVTRIGPTPTKEGSREPRGAVGGDHVAVEWKPDTPR